MGLLRDILSHGYFPKELPPSFETHSFAMALTRNTALPSIFSDTRKTAKSCNYNLAIAGGLVRKLTLVNPIPFFQLARCIAQRWKNIIKTIDRSKLSKSIPTQKEGDTRALSASSEQSELAQWRAKLRASSLFLLKADIAQFYPSVYTHSIPWAIHTKSAAKKNRTDQLYGNKLDRLVRNGQDGQTMGIPIGPDTSLILAELLLSAVDENLQSDKKFSEAFRYYDDYEFTFESASKRDELLGSLQKYIGEYELRLNPKKTSAMELPSELEEDWVHTIRNFEIRSRPTSQRYSMLDFFDMLYSLVKAFPDRHVVKYALPRFYADKLEVYRENWSLLESLILQTLAAEPGGLSAAIRIFLEKKESGYEINFELLKAALTNRVKCNALVGNTSEVAWAVWGAIALDISLDEQVSKIVTSIDDSVIAVLALDARERGLLEIDNSDMALWTQYMSNDELYGPQWLLSYEARMMNWLPSIHPLGSDEAFGYLKQQKVTFYDSALTDPLASLSKVVKSATMAGYDF